MTDNRLPALIDQKNHVLRLCSFARHLALLALASPMYIVSYVNTVSPNAFSLHFHFLALSIQVMFGVDD